MSPQARMEYAQIVARRYLKAQDKKEKSKILDEFCATAGYHRKHGIRRLRSILFSDPPLKKNRERKYSPQADALLILIWEAYSHLCGERLHPYLPEAITVLKRLGHLHETGEVIDEVLSMSLGTVKRRIAAYKKRMGKGLFHGLSSTKPGSLLKKQIPIKTICWDEKLSGFLEIDLVAHCGGSLLGELIYTLQTVDLKTTWTERKAVMGKSQKVVFEAMQEIEAQLPFDLKGIDSDNGSEFINHQLWKYCEENNIAFTRSRPYMKKDNAHIEQKNWPLVRKILGYDRFDTMIQLNLINDLYDNELRLYLNFFQPTMKLKEKVRVGSKYKRKYDTPKTPYQRVLDCPEIPEERKEELRKLYATLDPVKLRKAIEQKVARIIRTVKGGNLCESEKKPLKRNSEGRKTRKKKNKH